jgi:hypothetical protein
MASDVQRVFDVWRRYRPRPDYCRLTAARRRLIGARLRDYPAECLIALVVYANEADVAECRFWRGQNDRRAEYLDLTNLLRVQKLDGRVERALLWRDAQTEQAVEEARGMDLGPLALLRGGGPSGEA